MIRARRSSSSRSAFWFGTHSFKQTPGEPNKPEKVEAQFLSLSEHFANTGFSDPNQINDLYLNTVTGAKVRAVTVICSAG